MTNQTSNTNPEEQKLKLFVWSITDCYPDEFIAFARTALEARKLIFDQLGFYPDKLNKTPTVYESPIAIVSMGEE